jgi:nuclear-control-of-ATPase protein 2
MPSEFVDHYTRFLAFSTSRPVSPGPSPRSEPRLNEATNIVTGRAKHSERKAKLHALLVSLNQNTTTPQDIQQYTRSLQEISHSGHDDENITGISREVSTPLDPEEVAMEGAIIGKLAVALYSAGLETYLTQATEAEAEAEWWADVEGSRANVALYLLQSMLLISAIFFGVAQSYIFSTPSAAR